MGKIIMVLLACLMALSEVHAIADDVVPSDDIVGNDSVVTLAEYSHYKYRFPSRKAVAEDGDGCFLHVHMTDAGTLEQMMGDKLNSVDSLIVDGPVNEQDLYTMWKASFKGRLECLDIKNAELEDSVIPDNAFFHIDEQLSEDSSYINCIRLRRIVFPDCVKRIGSAFSYAVKLENIELPSNLKVLGDYCFSDCVSLCQERIVFPEGFEEIGSMAFLSCRKLTGEIVLPSTIKTIKNGAFAQSRITKCNFPEGLEEIGSLAFYACRLKEVVLPNSCQRLPGDNHFCFNYDLESITLPEGIESIPPEFLRECISLKSLRIPDSVKQIGSGAMYRCIELTDLKMPKNLRVMWSNALDACLKLKEVSFPETMERLGSESCCDWQSVTRISCAAQVPPLCDESFSHQGWAPFGDYTSDSGRRTRQDTPVYVPTGTSEAYRNAKGWDYFENFIETDFTGIDGLDIQDSDRKGILYDLEGRIVKAPIDNHIYVRDGRKFIYRKGMVNY